MERRTGRQEEMERISKNRIVCRKPPNYAESRRYARKRARTVWEGGNRKGPRGTSLVPYFILEAGRREQSLLPSYHVLSNGTPVDRVQSGGNWKSPTMVLKYARRTGIANEGVIISE